MGEKFTPGPWAWFGNQHGIYLATTHSGRTYVMAFDRMGMQGAQPSFRRDHIMVPASELIQFAVGDGKARGFKEGRSDESVYRYDITGIDCPDAHLIAAAPELYEALKEVVGISLQAFPSLAHQPAFVRACAAFSKARGEPV